jgi:hypothetical protein
VSKDIDCQVFEDQLDAFSQGALSDEGMEQLRLHARVCPDCAMMLRMKEHLAYPSLKELEAKVPEVLVASMWPRVEAEVTQREARRPARSVSRWTWGSFAPAAAAAVVVLAVGTGFLWHEVRQLRTRESVLIQQIAEQERWLAELDLRTAPSAVARTAGLAGSHNWQRVLARRQSVTVSELTVMLNGIPTETTLLDAAEAERLMKRVPFLRATSRKVLASEIRSDDGLQAGELLELVKKLDLSSETRISTARVLALARGTSGVEKS